MASKRKRSSESAAGAKALSEEKPRPRQRTAVPAPTVAQAEPPQPLRRQASRKNGAAITDPNSNPEILDGVSSLRASPDAVPPPSKLRKSAAAKEGAAPSQPAEHVPIPRRRGRTATTTKSVTAQAPAEDVSDAPAPGTSRTAVADPDPDPGVPGSKKKQHVKVNGAEATAPPLQNGIAPSGQTIDEAVGVTISPDDNDAGLLDEDQGEGVEDVAEALSRPPPVNSDYLPLPWKGRLGYACLNTYLRNASPPVFSSRTCRIASILEHRHPLKDPSQPEHPTKNRPDKDQPADVVRGQKFVEELGLANARDAIKMLRWNDRYGIKFMRLSSEMFPFASHAEYGYKLAPFAAETLAEVGKVANELGHRVTTHPGQFTQLGSPRKSVIDASVLDLAYHEEMLSLLKLSPQQDRDAVMILHLGGAFGDKPATLDRFRENYSNLPQRVKDRLVLENDDVVWSVHELLPLCQELNIPFVLDFHHHNIVFDSSKIREGTKDIVDLFPQILETWTRKNKTPKMHYSEPCPDAITGRARRKHSPRVMTFPPCPDTMDLMIEAKDKEQAVFELMRTFKLPGFDTFNDMIPHVRPDENRPLKPKPKKVAKKGKKKQTDDLEDVDMKLEDADEDEKPPPLIPDNEVGMGGPEGRVYWPPGMEDWLRPAKRVVKKKEEGAATPAKGKRKKKAAADEASLNSTEGTPTQTPAKKAASKRAASTKKKAPRTVPTPSASDDEDSSPLSDLSDGEGDDSAVGPLVSRPAPTRQRSGRVGGRRISYKEEADDADEMSV
ncbi:UV-endonuclease UvdE [Periconia macrospinosa]|uniref:UV-endonuclease UvdE n=1 Tax=Periconia macrospinosa TaxID=97972 RepID=A0A2V1E564_9PLEO|nr:UV-endonuclease UvdE [Periconia macrospinosa]